jgi:hypothetical protein
VTVTCHPPFALTPRLAFPEMTPLAFLPARAPIRAVLMPLIIEDDYYEIIREFAIPDRSVSSVTQAGAWSARNSRSGFVPSTVLADFTDDPDRDTGPWIAAGVVKRAKGGVRFIGGRGMTVVNAADIEAKIAKTRAANNERKQRSRERLRAEQAEKIRAAAVTPAVTRKSRATRAGVTGVETEKQEKTQVSTAAVTRDIAVTSRVTEDPSRARTRDDFDFDFDSSLVSQSSAVDARAREPARGASDDELAGAVIAAVREREFFDLNRETALKVGAMAVARRKKGPPTDRAAYAAAVIANEKDLYAELLREVAPPRAEIFSQRNPAPGAHPFKSDGAPSPTCLTCFTPEGNYRHDGFRQEAAAS